MSRKDSFPPAQLTRGVISALFATTGRIARRFWTEDEAKQNDEAEKRVAREEWSPGSNAAPGVNRFFSPPLKKGVEENSKPFVCAQNRNP